MQWKREGAQKQSKPLIRREKEARRSGSSKKKGTGNPVLQKALDDQNQQRKRFSKINLEDATVAPQFREKEALQMSGGTVSSDSLQVSSEERQETSRSNDLYSQPSLKLANTASQIREDIQKPMNEQASIGSVKQEMSRDAVNQERSYSAQAQQEERRSNLMAGNRPFRENSLQSVQSSQFSFRDFTLNQERNQEIPVSSTDTRPRILSNQTYFGPRVLNIDPESQNERGTDSNLQQNGKKVSGGMKQAIANLSISQHSSNRMSLNTPHFDQKVDENLKLSSRDSNSLSDQARESAINSHKSKMYAEIKLARQLIEVFCAIVCLLVMGQAMASSHKVNTLTSIILGATILVLKGRLSSALNSHTRLACLIFQLGPALVSYKMHTFHEAELLLAGTIALVHLLLDEIEALSQLSKKQARKEQEDYCISACIIGLKCVHIRAKELMVRGIGQLTSGSILMELIYLVAIMTAVFGSFYIIAVIILRLSYQPTRKAARKKKAYTPPVECQFKRSPAFQLSQTSEIEQSEQNKQESVKESILEIAERKEEDNESSSSMSAKEGEVSAESECEARQFGKTKGILPRFPHRSCQIQFSKKELLPSSAQSDNRNLEEERKEMIDINRSSASYSQSSQMIQPKRISKESFQMSQGGESFNRHSAVLTSLDTNNPQQRLLQHCLLSYISQSIMICKIEKDGRMSKRKFSTPFTAEKLYEMQNNSQKTSLQGSRENKIKVTIFHAVPNFFELLPHFNLMTHILKNRKENSPNGMQKGPRHPGQNSKSILIKNNLKWVSQGLMKSFSLKSESSLQNTQQNESSNPSSIPMSHFRSEQPPSHKLSAFKQFHSQGIFQKDVGALETELLHLKIYQPYYMSFRTIIQFMGQEKCREKLSVIDILEQFSCSNSASTRLFFRVDLNSDFQSDFQEKERGSILSNQNTSSLFRESNLSLRFKQMILQMGTEIEEIQENQDSLNEAESSNESNPVVKIEKESSKSKITLQSKTEGEESDSQSFEISDSHSVHPHKLFSLNKTIDQASANTSRHYDGFGERQKQPSASDDHIMYFEFEMKQVDSPGVEKGLTFVSIKNITQVVKIQQKISDALYQEAIENNFSHEQMTPLNCIKNFTQMVREMFQNSKQDEQEISNQLEELQNSIFTYQISLPLHLVQKLESSFDRISRAQILLSSVEQSAQSLIYFNMNQISRMQIKKKQMNINLTESQDVLVIVKNAIWPFEMQIDKKEINVYLVQRIDHNFTLISDWNRYELILFNIIQNAVKYNSQRGDIIIVLSCKKHHGTSKIEEEKKSQISCSPLTELEDSKDYYILETDVIDTGIGISPERQKLLFIPFLEMRNMQGIMRARNDNIGLGLSGSREISLRMGGDITLKQSKEGLTVFSFKLPIQVKELTIDDLSKDNQKYLQLQGTKNRKMKQEVISYFKENGLKDKFKFEANKSTAKARRSILSPAKIVESSFDEYLFPKTPARKKSELKESKTNLIDYIQVPITQVKPRKSLLNNMILQLTPNKKLSGSPNTKKSNSGPRNQSRGASKFPELDLGQIEEKKEEQHVVEQKKRKSRPSTKTKIRQFQNKRLSKRIQLKRFSKERPPDSESSLKKLCSKLKQKSNLLKKREFEIPQLGQTPNQQLMRCYKDLDEPLSRENKHKLIIEMISNNHLHPINNLSDEPVSYKRNKKREEAVYQVMLNRNDSSSGIDEFVLDEHQNKEESFLDESEEGSWVSESQYSHVPSRVASQISPEKYKLSGQISSLQISKSAVSHARNDFAKECQCQPKILIVDDTMFNLFTLSNLIETQFGIKPDEAENGQIAVDKFSQSTGCFCGSSYKLILMDIQMPVMDGHLATEQILKIANNQRKQSSLLGNFGSRSKSSVFQESKNEENTYMQKVNVVAVTAYTSAQVKDKCFKVGMKDIVGKPIDVNKLSEIMYRYFFEYSEDKIKQLMSAKK